MGTKVVCLTITGRPAEKQGQKKEAVGIWRCRSKKKKKKISQPSLALSPEHLPRKGRKQSCSLDYVFWGFPELHTSLKKNKTKEPVPEERRGLCRKPDMNRSPEFSCQRTTANRLPFPPYLCLGISLLSFLFLLSCFIFLLFLASVCIFSHLTATMTLLKLIIAKAEGRIALFLKKKFLVHPRSIMAAGRLKTNIF